MSEQPREPFVSRPPRIDPQLAARRTERGRLPGDAVVRVARSPGFKRRASGVLVATEEASGDASILRMVLDPTDGRRVLKTERMLRGSIDSARAM